MCKLAEEVDTLKSISEEEYDKWLEDKLEYEDSNDIKEVKLSLQYPKIIRERKANSLMLNEENVEAMCNLSKERIIKWINVCSKYEKEYEDREKTIKEALKGKYKRNNSCVFTEIDDEDLNFLTIFNEEKFKEELKEIVKDRIESKKEKIAKNEEEEEKRKIERKIKRKKIRKNISKKTFIAIVGITCAIAAKKGYEVKKGYDKLSNKLNQNLEHFGYRYHDVADPEAGDAITFNIGATNVSYEEGIEYIAQKAEQAFGDDKVSTYIAVSSYFGNNQVIAEDIVGMKPSFGEKIDAALDAFHNNETKEIEEEKGARTK